MRSALFLASFLDPALLLLAQGLRADPWQHELLLARAPYLLLNCSRQSGKSTTVAALALHQILTAPGALVLLVAPSERQSHELFRKVLVGYQRLQGVLHSRKWNQSELELANGSRIVALPGREDTIRSFSGVNLLIIDEASRVPDDLYRSVRPMLAVSRGRLLALSTPFGRRGWFYHEWIGSGPWQRYHIPWKSCPRIDPAFIEEELRALGEAWVDQEYNCLFTALEGLVYPDFETALYMPRDESSSPAGKKLGGIDFGFRNPFAAIWGVLDHDDVLWILGERYERKAVPDDNAAALPPGVTWYADPASPSDIEHLRRAGHVVRRGDNSISRGIALVTARLRTGGLKVSRQCVNLIKEAQLYRYDSEGDNENPHDAHNHALAALRYLISKLDAAGRTAVRTPQPEPPPLPDDERHWLPWS